MDTPTDLLATLSEAVARGDWLVVSVAAVVVLTTLVGAGLKMAGRPVPILDTVAGLAGKALKALPRKPAAAPSPDEKQGVEAVVEVKKVEDSETLK